MTHAAGYGDRPFTADELLDLPDDGWCYELSHGLLIRDPPAGGRHGLISAAVATALHAFVTGRRLGYVVGRCGFRIASDPDTVRAPDVAFIAAARLPEGLPPGYIPFAPDLAIEIVSPHDRMSDLTRKVTEYLDAGTRLVWLVDPETRTAVVHHSRTQAVILRESEVLDGGEVLPGFALPLNDVFDG